MVGVVRHYVYADKSYPLRPWSTTAHRGPSLSEEEEKFNKSMNMLRVSVEWSYGEVKQYFTKQDFSRKLKLRETPIAILYTNAVLLFNFKTCLGHGCQNPNFYRCAPPTIERYCIFQ